MQIVGLASGPDSRARGRLPRSDPHLNIGCALPYTDLTCNPVMAMQYSGRRGMIWFPWPILGSNRKKDNSLATCLGIHGGTMSITCRTSPLRASILIGMVCTLYANLGFSQEKIRPEVTESPRFMSPDTAQWLSCGGEEQGIPRGCEYAVVNGDPAKGPAHVLVRVPASARFPKLWHSTSEHGLLIQGKFVGRGEDGKEFAVMPGTYWYFPAGFIHGGATCAEDSPCLFYEAYDKPFDITIVR